MKKRRPGTPRRPKAARPATAVTREDADREWLLSVFASLTRGPSDVDALVAFRTRSRMRWWSAGLFAAQGERRRTAGRRLVDLARALDPLSEA